MIDTIVLMIQPKDFAIRDHNRFSPSTKGLFEPPYYAIGGRGNISCVQNPSNKNLKQGIYKPRLTVTKRCVKGGFAVFLKVEFSAPKLIYGNNFEELTDKDFEQVIENLHKALYEMGVVVFPKILREAPVSAVHYSKNIPLTDYSTPGSILTKISKINLTMALDLNKTDYRNEGHCLKFHANSHELALYDKMKDLEKSKKSEKRAVEKDTAIQLDLFETFKPKKPFEVLRMETRLNKREVIRRTFKKLRITAEPTFKAVFKTSISRKVLSSYFELIKVGYSLVAYEPKSAKDFVSEFRFIQPKAKVRKMLQMLGLLIACKEMGVRGFREAIRIYGNHHWPRLLKDWRECNLTATSPALKPIEGALQGFKPLRLRDYCTLNAKPNKAEKSTEML